MVRSADLKCATPTSQAKYQPPRLNNQGFLKIRGSHFGGPHSKDYSKMASILAFPSLGKLPSASPMQVQDLGYPRHTWVPIKQIRGLGRKRFDCLVLHKVVSTMQLLIWALGCQQEMLFHTE